MLREVLRRVHDRRRKQGLALLDLDLDRLAVNQLHPHVIVGERDEYRIRMLVHVRLLAGPVLDRNHSNEVVLFYDLVVFRVGDGRVLGRDGRGADQQYGGGKQGGSLHSTSPSGVVLGNQRTPHSGWNRQSCQGVNSRTPMISPSSSPGPVHRPTATL